MENHFSTNQLLHNNPVYLECHPSSKPLASAESESFEKYLVHLKENGQVIGHTKILFGSDGTKELNWPTLDDDFRRRGMGTALYVAAAAITSAGETATLQSSNCRLLYPAAKNVWDSLVQRDLATPPDWENGKYVFRDPRT